MGGEIPVSVSAGLSFYPDDSSELETLIKKCRFGNVQRKIQKILHYDFPYLKIKICMLICPACWMLAHPAYPCSNYFISPTALESVAAEG